eukprot:scaffold15421_cov168-Amphora_coffeaeformis.AAC.3
MAVQDWIELGNGNGAKTNGFVMTMTIRVITIGGNDIASLRQFMKIHIPANTGIVFCNKAGFCSVSFKTALGNGATLGCRSIPPGPPFPLVGEQHEFVLNDWQKVVGKFLQIHGIDVYGIIGLDVVRFRWLSQKLFGWNRRVIGHLILVGRARWCYLKSDEGHDELSSKERLVAVVLVVSQRRRLFLRSMEHNSDRPAPSKWPIRPNRRPIGIDHGPQ